MFANAPHDHRQELDEIVEDLPSNVDGPASIAQRTSTKLHCTNPDDINRIRKIKHFQEYVVGITKDGIYFVADALERMFPENSAHTKLLLGTCSASKLLVKYGATVTSTHKVGAMYNFMLESLSRTGREFQDPFSAGELIPLSQSLNRIAPSSVSGPTSGLLVGASVKLGFWRTFLLGKSNIWEILVKTGVKPFFYGLIVGFVDEILGSLVPARYRTKLNYIKNLFKGASGLIGTAVLIVMIANSKVSLTTALLSVLISFVGNIIGGAIGSGVCKLLDWTKKNYFPSSQVISDNLVVPLHVDMPLPQTESSVNAALHNCGQDNNGYIYIGLCINCNNQPALFGFVHKEDDVAHSAFCLQCSSLYRRPMCVCCAEISSTYYFSPGTPVCAAKTCIRVADCVTCDEQGDNSPNSANIWRLKKCEETFVTRKTVTLDLRYCSAHNPVTNRSDHSDQFRYGKLYSMGYM